MLTFQDFQKAAQDGLSIPDFLRRAISEHESSPAYREAQTARLYYTGDNPTISARKHVIYDELGRGYEDIWTPNNKLKSQVFRAAVMQRVSYLMSNGVTFKEAGTKNRLGTARRPFDTQAAVAYREAMIGGVSYSYFNHDHVEVFPFEHYCPLLDEMTGSARAGVYRWRLADDKPMTVYLFEEDGYTVFSENRNSGNLEIVKKKRPYRLTSVKSSAMEELFAGEPYPAFPIIPLKLNDQGTPLLHGKQETIDGLDLARSNGLNNTDMDTLYWLFEGLEGMNNFDIVRAVFDLRRIHGLATPPTDGTAHITPHTAQAPYEGTQATIAELKEQLYSDLMMFNPESVVARSDTATAIRAAYELLNVDTNVFEIEQLQPYMLQILELAGIKGETVTFTRDTITNVQESMQTLMMLAPYVDAQYIRERGMRLLGDIDKIQEVSARMAAEETQRIETRQTQEETEASDNDGL